MSNANLSWRDDTHIFIYMIRSKPSASKKLALKLTIRSRQVLLTGLYTDKRVYCLLDHRHAWSCWTRCFGNHCLLEYEGGVLGSLNNARPKQKLSVFLSASMCAHSILSQINIVYIYVIALLWWCMRIDQGYCQCKVLQSLSLIKNKNTNLTYIKK